MRKVIILLSIFLISCKDDNWGGKVLDFAHNEAPSIVESLSKKDLESKWFQFFFMTTNHGLEEITKASLILLSYPRLDLNNLDKDNMKLMKVAYEVDQQIEKLIMVNNIIFNAQSSLKTLKSSCENTNLFSIYTENRTYLLSSLQMAVPQINVSYGASVSFSFGDSSSKSTNQNNNTHGVDAIPLIGNVTSFFSEQSYKKNLGKFKEAQSYINNIRLDEGSLAITSKSICEQNQLNFKEAILELDKNVTHVKIAFIDLYSALNRTRDALAPQVIQNIILTKFSSEDLYIYSVEADNKFTQRVMEIYTIIQNINNTEAKMKEDLSSIEKRIEIIDSLIAEVVISKDSILGKSNQKLLVPMFKMLNQKRALLLTSFNKGVTL
jgi:hypothetical protein